MILSTYSTSELQNIISTGNAVLLKNVKGLGLKTAQKILVELNGKMLDLSDVEQGVVAVGGGSEVYDEALAALVMLGFAKAASEKTLRQIIKESPTISVEDAVRDALKRL
jgi:Holliday junction DNA helicase RuvA